MIVGPGEMIRGQASEGYPESPAAETAKAAEKATIEAAGSEGAAAASRGDPENDAEALPGLEAVVAARVLARRKVQGKSPGDTAGRVGKHSSKGIPVSDYWIG